MNINDFQQLEIFAASAVSNPTAMLPVEGDDFHDEWLRNSVEEVKQEPVYIKQKPEEQMEGDEAQHPPTKTPAIKQEEQEEPKRRYPARVTAKPDWLIDYIHQF